MAETATTEPSVEPEPVDPPTVPEPTETVDPEVEKWKALARKNETQAKANAAAAKRLKEIEDAAKSDEERRAEERTVLEQERDDAIAEAAKLRAAVTYGLEEADLDLLGTGTAQEITERAERLAKRLAAAVPPKPRPDPNQGKHDDLEPSLDAQIAEAAANGDTRAVIALNNRKLAELAKQ